MRSILFIFLAGMAFIVSPPIASAVETKCICHYQDNNCTPQRSQEACRARSDCSWAAGPSDGLGTPGSCQSRFRRWCQETWRTHPTQGSCNTIDIISGVQPLPSAEDDTRELRYVWAGHSDQAPENAFADVHFLRLSTFILDGASRPQLRLIDYWNSGCSYFSPAGYDQFLSYVEPNVGSLLNIMPSRNENLQVNVWGNQMCSTRGDADMSGSSYIGFQPWRRIRFNKRGPIHLDFSYSFTPCNQYEGYSCNEPWMRNTQFICAESAQFVQDMRCSQSPLFPLVRGWHWRGSRPEIFLGANGPTDFERELELAAIPREATPEATPSVFEATSDEFTFVSENQSSMMLPDATPSPSSGGSSTAEYDLGYVEPNAVTLQQYADLWHRYAESNQLNALPADNPYYSPTNLQESDELTLQPQPFPSPIASPAFTHSYSHTTTFESVFVTPVPTPTTGTFISEQPSPTVTISPYPIDSEHRESINPMENVSIGDTWVVSASPTPVAHLQPAFDGSVFPISSDPDSQLSTFISTSPDWSSCLGDFIDVAIFTNRPEPCFRSQRLPVPFEGEDADVQGWFKDTLNRPRGETCYKRCTMKGFKVEPPGCPLKSFCHWFHRNDSCSTPTNPDPNGSVPGDGDFGNCTPLLVR